MIGLGQDVGRHEVHRDARERDGEHDPAVDVVGGDETLDRLDRDEQGHRRQGHAVDGRTEDFGSLEPEGPAAARRSLREP